MDYLTGMKNIPVYEFPYSGYETPSIPFSNVSPSSVTSPLESLLHYQPSTFNAYGGSSPTSSNLGYNTTIYQVPGNVPLEEILRELGVDVNTLQRADSVNNPYTSESSYNGFDYSLYPRRRRRMVCRETSDSDSDDYDRHSPRHRRRRRGHRNHQKNNDEKSPLHLHSLLGNATNKSEKASNNISPFNSMPNINAPWQSMDTIPSQQQQNAVNSGWNQAGDPSGRNTGGVANAFNQIQGPTGNFMLPPPAPMQNFVPPPPNVPVGTNPPNPAVVNVWNKAQNASEKKARSLSDIFNKMRQPTGNIIQQPPQNPAAVPNFSARPNLPPGINQPNSAATNVWNKAFNAPPPAMNQMSGGYQPPPPAMNPAWNQMLRGSPPPPTINPAWNQMSGGYQPPPPPPTMNPAWNQMSRASPPPPAMNPAWNQALRASPPPPAMNPAWNQMSGAYSPPPSAMNSGWNKMQQGSNPPYYQTPIGGPQGGPRSTGPTTFASLLSGPQTQQSPYGGGM